MLLPLVVVAVVVPDAELERVVAADVTDGKKNLDSNSCVVSWAPSSSTTH